MRKILNEQLDITDAHPLKARFYDYKNFTYPWHFHSEFEVIYIEKGYGLGMAGDGMTDFSDQQLFLLGSNLPHYLENAPEYDLKEELRVNGVIIQFEKDFMQYAFSHYSQFQGINRLLEEAQRGLLFSLSNCTDNIPQIIKRIPQKEGVGQIVEFLQLLDALTHLTPQKVISSPAYDPVPARFNGRKIEKVMAFLNKHYTQPICLEDYHVYSSQNLVDWTDHGVILSQNNVPWVDSESYSMWAPDCVYKNGKYYFYFPAKPKNMKVFSVGVAVSDTPYGPFMPDWKPIEGIQGIDPCVLIDKQGSAYIYWAGNGLRMARLKDNMKELASAPVLIEGLPEGFK